ncbi:MAG: SusC/RagA family TonB-linked outer membrane protein [Bacteroidales bacterium]
MKQFYREKVKFSRRVFYLACTALLICAFSEADAQSKIEASGIVIEQGGTPMPGVYIVEKGTNNGAITDREGKFNFKVAEGATIKVSFIGFKNIELPASKDMTVTIKEEVEGLDEVVVTGYSSQQKKDITGSVAVVNTEELLQSSGSSSMQQLQGRASGVVIGSSGTPGSSTSVRIRGVGTINNNGPLFVIDGVSTTNQDMNSINPNDIESMQILKDASAASIYGAEASNGVIIITTKKGTKDGSPTFEYNGYFGFQKSPKSFDLLESQDRLDLEWTAKTNAYSIRGVDKYPSHQQFGTGASPSIPNYLTSSGANGLDSNPDDYSYPDNLMVPFSNTNWWDEVTQTAPITNHQFTARGGTEKGNYSFGLNYFDQKGTVIESYYKRYSARINTSFKIRNWFRIGENLTYSYSKDYGLNSASEEAGPHSWIYRSSPWVPVRDIKGNYAGSKIAGTGNFENVVANYERDKDNYYTDQRVFGNAWIELEPIKNLVLKSSFGIDYNSSYYYRMTKRNPEFSETTGRNSLEERSQFTLRWVWTNTATYTRIFNEKHKLSALLGSEAITDDIGRAIQGNAINFRFEDNTDTWVISQGDFDDIPALSEYMQQYSIYGLFGRVDYAFKDKYLLTAVLRRDGISKFSKENRIGYFPSFSMGWRITEEKFMKNTRNWLSDLKLRMGYGQTGNANMDRKYNYTTLYSIDPDRSNYDLSGVNTAAETGFIRKSMANADTKWETTEMTNIGLDAIFFDGKLATNFEWYYRRTSDMLVEAEYSDLAGDGDPPYENIGDMENKGIDFAITYRDQKGNWSWEASLNLSHYKNEVLKLYDSEDAFKGGDGVRFEGTPVARTMKGQAIGSFFGYNIVGFYENDNDVLDAIPLGADKATIKTSQYIGKYRFEDVNGDGRITPDDRKFIGSPHPDLTAGLNLSASYKNFDASLFLFTSIGNDIFNNTKYFTDFWLFEGNRSSTMRDKSWEPGKTDATLPILDYQDSYSGTNPNSYYVENGSYLRFKNFVLGYTIPKRITQKATISNFRIYLQVENFWTITNYSGIEPDLANPDADNADDLRKGIDMGSWPQPTSFIVGFGFKF